MYNSVTMVILHKLVFACMLLALTVLCARRWSKSHARVQPSMLDQHDIAFNRSPLNIFTTGHFVRHAGLSKQSGGSAAPPAAWLRRGQRTVMNAQVLERPVLKLGGPPSPPPPPADDTGPGGGGGEGRAFLKRIENSDAVRLVLEWMAMVRVLRMGGQLGGSAALYERYTKSLDALEELRSFSRNSPAISFEDGQNMIVGMYDSNTNQLEALAAGSLKKYGAVKWEEPFKGHGQFMIKYIAVSPTELRAENSLADLHIRKGLRVMAEQLGVELEFKTELLDSQ